MKEKLVGDFKEVTSSQALVSFTCVCCAHELLLKERQCKGHVEINTDILCVPSVHQTECNVSAPSTLFSAGPLENVLLSPDGVKSNHDGTYCLELCMLCLHSLQRNTIPKHALANRLYVGPVPDKLSDLTMVEECMIAHAMSSDAIFTPIFHPFSTQLHFTFLTTLSP